MENISNLKIALWSIKDVLNDAYNEAEMNGKQTDQYFFSEALTYLYKALTEVDKQTAKQWRTEANLQGGFSQICYQVQRDAMKWK